jgi:ABC-type nitrate/sulfonate/bicarbonate transport system substrate-binding protein
VNKKIAFLLLSIILGLPFPGRALSAIRIRLSQSNVGLTAAPLWVATSHGFFSKYGLELEPVYVRNSTIQIMALTTGEVQLSHTGGAPTLSAAARATISKSLRPLAMESIGISSRARRSELSVSCAAKTSE